MRRPRPDPAAPRHLVVRLPRPLGDAVMATPALRALRAALPATRITWAGGRAALGILEGLPWRDDVMPLSSWMAHGALGPWRGSRMLRRLGADATLLLPNSWSSALAAWLARTPVRVGSGLGGRGALLTRTVDLPMEGDRLAPRSMRRHYLDLVAPFGARDDGGGTALATTPFDEERATRRLAGLVPENGFLGVNAGAAYGATKVYPPARMGEAASRARRETGLLPVVLCGPGEEELATATARAIGAPCIATHDDPPDLGELKALVRRCRLVLTTDAGPRHVAEAFGVPTVVVMGPTDPRWGEGGDALVVRREDLPCLGCHLRACPIGHPCMEGLDPAVVAEAVASAVASPVPRGAASSRVPGAPVDSRP